jgi:hypothetical protein
MLTKALEGDRSVGAVKGCRLRAGNGCEGSDAVKTEDRRQNSEFRTRTPNSKLNSKPRTPNPKPRTLHAFTDHGCHERMGHRWPIPWRASAPSVPGKDVDLGPATAARGSDALKTEFRIQNSEPQTSNPELQTPNPPRLHRSWLPRTDGPLLADPLEGDRSVGAVKGCRLRAGNGCEGERRPEDRRQNSEFRTPNLKPRTPNPKPQTLHAFTDDRCHERMGHCWPIPWRATAPSAP